MEQINADFSERAVMHSADMEWRESPTAGVWRKRLELAGDDPETGRATSVVRYDAGSRFPEHPHPDGEEIFVLSGVLSDELGDHPAGTYLLNPEGFVHAPYSEEGCELLVKLRQYAGPGREHVRIDTGNSQWTASGVEGVDLMPLYGDPDGDGERMFLARFAPGCRFPEHGHAGGEEVFVIEGSFEDENGRYGPGTWLRQPVGSRHSVWSDEGATVYVKLGHLAGA